MSWEIYELRRLAASDLRFMSLGQFIDQLELIDEIRPRHDVAYALRPVADVADPVADEGAPVLVPADPPAHFADVADLGGGGGAAMDERPTAPAVFDAPPVAAPGEPRPWTRAEQDRMVALRVDGLTYAQIGERLGRTAKAISVRLARINGPHRQKPSADRPASRKAAAPRPAQKVAQSVAPVASSDPAPAEAVPVPPAMLTGLAHDVLAHLAGLDDSFAPADDLDLARAVLDRTDFAIVADDLGCEPQVARARWQALRDFSPILTDRGHLSIDGQAALMLALKYRACHAAG